MEQNLPELRDIHLPDGVSPFPPAYGWWVILGSVLLLLVLTELFLIIRRKSKKRYALYLLQHIPQDNIAAAALQISEILRRICVFKYKEAAALYGKPWLEFLNQHSMNPESAAYTKQDADKLRQFSARWIGENL